MPIDENGASDAYAMFQQWLARANEDYAARDKQLRADAARREAEHLEQQRRRAEERRRILERAPQV